MGKGITFVEKDQELVKEIEAFRKEQRLPTFVDAVRVLCQNGLHMSDVVKNLK